jgi:hypothetical protein
MKRKEIETVKEKSLFSETLSQK